MSHIFTYSDQQIAIFDEIVRPTAPIVLIKAVAGAAKTSSLTEAIRRFKSIFPTASVRYIIFGTLAADEAKREFGRNAIVSTLHSFAYAHTVKQYSLGEVRPFLTWRDLPKSIKRPFGSDYELIQMIESYCLSDYTSVDAYAQANQETEGFKHSYLPILKQLLNQMASGAMPITHSFYLKLFHIFVMDGTIQLPSSDRLLVDEFQDMSGMALDIINAIPAEQKIFVGDSNQSIFEFLNLKDGFKFYPDAKVLPLSKSFRVDNSYAPAIQNYLRTYLDSDAVFEGMDYPSNQTIRTKAYLVRNNNTLISKMIEFNQSNTPYHLSNQTKLNQIFKLPLALIYAKPAFDQKDYELKHLQHDIDDYGSLSAKKRESMSLFSYLLEVNKEDKKLKSAIQLVVKHTPQKIIEAFNKAKEHQLRVASLWLMTAHTSKGSTFDEVELDDDLNDSINEAIEAYSSNASSAITAELCLGFVSITRHRHVLKNCKFLTKDPNDYTL